MDKGGFVIATDPDGKILTEKVKDESGREVSRILSRDEVKAPEDRGEPSSVPVQDISKSKSFVRRETPDEIVDKRNRALMAKRLSTPEVDTPMSMNKDALMAKRLSTPEVDDPKDALMAKRLSIPEVDTPMPVEKQDPEELRDAATYAETGPVYSGQPLTGFVRQTPRSDETNDQKLSRVPVVSNPQKFSNIPDTIELINKYVNNGDVEGLKGVVAASNDPENDLNVHPSIIDRVKDILLQIGIGMLGPEGRKKFLPEHIQKKIRLENSKLEENLTETEFQNNKSFMDGNVQTIDNMEELGTKKKDSNQVDPYKYNDIKSTYDQFMELGATSGFGDVKRKQVATTAQGAALTDPNYQIPVGMKLLPHKNLNVPHFIELLYRLGKKENVNQEIYKDSYNGIAGGLFQLSFEFFAPKELIDQKNKENNTNLKEKELGKVPKTRRAESTEEFYSPYYQRTMALALLMDHLKTYDGDPVKAIVAYNAGKTRANKLGPNNNFTDFERYVLANNPKDGKRIVRDAKRLVEAVLPEQFNFPAPVVNMSMPVPKPKRVGGFV